MYKHTQIGWPWLVVLGVLILFFVYGAYVGILYPYWIPLICILVLIAVCMIIFPSLTVTGDDDLIEVRFTPGLIKKKFRFEEIESARPVRNRWWYGWGIRKIPGGWLFNVSGLEAVELLMKNGRIYRIGTDEPQALSEFIQRNIEGRKRAG